MTADVARLPDPVEPVTGRGALARALALVQSALPHVGKDNVGVVKSEKANYKYSYADLSDVTRAILPALGRVGLAWTALPTMLDGGRFVLRYSLMHTSGESLDGEYPLPDPSRTQPQQLGSALTYARRYALCSVTGVAPSDDDDDAAAAQQRPAAHYDPPPARQPQRPAQPARDWHTEIAEAAGGRDDAALRRLWHEADGLPEVRAAITEAKRAMDAAPAGGEDAALVRPEQTRHMHALWKTGGISDRDERLAITGVLIGRKVASSSDLTAAEADVVIARLREHDKGTGGLYQQMSRWLDEAVTAREDGSA